eukprot:CAMPEP_0176489560 /NCGR_PEP_ID=MMETSP0200_2-20121128/7355_1 /TAXON_ID=947934 /ORGANISM="Chaetoceros sp., Strain GSL56" /LENGTH=629 /DNA_ID=CAMNT_0017886713 /DNA_START=39 /DNA_END=1928 /DNA_ORIENTATION=-
MVKQHNYAMQESKRNAPLFTPLSKRNAPLFTSRQHDDAGDNKAENDNDASSSSCYNDSFNTAATEQCPPPPPLMTPGIWKYSKTRQVAFWMKQSIKSVVSPNFHAAYRNDPRNTGNRQSVLATAPSPTVTTTTACALPSLSTSLTLPLQRDTSLVRKSSNTLASSLDSNIRDSDMDSVNDLNDSEYCENIDQAMLCLGQEPILLCNDVESFLNHDERGNASSGGYLLELQDSCIRCQDIWHPYDWILDGDPISDESMYHDDNCKVESDDCEKKSLEEETPLNDRFKFDRDAKICDKEKESLEKVLAGLELEDEGSGEMNNENCHRVTEFQEDNVFATVNESELDNYIQNNSNMETLEIVTTQNDWEQSGNFVEWMNTSRSWTENPDWIDEWDPLPDFLPFEDPSTPEGAFVRRWQKERDRCRLHGGMDGNHSISSHSPSYQIYCNENHDAFLDILTGVPWEYYLMQDEGGEGHISAMDQDVYLIEILSSLDELSKDVSHELLSKVQQKETEIHDEMKRVQAVDCDVASALSDLSQATALLQRARGTDEKHGGSRDGLFGGLYIIEESESRSRLREVNDLILSVEEMMQMEASIADFVDNFSVDLFSDGASMAAFLETCENERNLIRRAD